MNLMTKKDFNDLCLSILNPLKGKYSEDGALLNLGTTATVYEDVSIGMEAFARPLWGLVPMWKGGCDDNGFDKIYLKGLCAGPDKSSADYWGKCRDNDQRFVEMASISYAMLFVPDKVWNPLTDEQKNNLAQWLYQINNFRVVDNNWTFFRVLVNAALYKCGMEYDKAQLKKDLDRIEEFYVGDGWYKDGGDGQKDYYIAFAFHFYSLIYAVAMEKEDSENSKKFKERAMLFAKQFIYWFADDGDALPYGRSLTYRFAQTAFWGACLMADVKPYPVDVIKGIIVRNFEKWFEESQIFDNSHILTIGYKYSNLIFAENYNAPGSPYWSMKAFAFMMLDDDHEFWSCTPAPLPELEQNICLPCADMTVSRINGEVFAYPGGTNNNFVCGQILPKYLKFSYSTLFGFNVPCSNIFLREAAPDNMLVFDMDGIIMQRRRNYSIDVSADKICSVWSPIEGIMVKSTVIPQPWGHERIHEITSDYECTAIDCGYAVACRDKDNFASSKTENTAECSNDFSYCSVEGGETVVIDASPNTNIVYNKTKIPAVKYEIHKGENKIKTVVRVVRQK